MRRPVLIPALIALSLCAPPLGAQVRRSPTFESRPLRAPLVLPMQILNGRPVIMLAIGAHAPVPFIVDTGALGNVVSASLAAGLDLPSIGDAMVGDPAGDPQPAEIFLASSLRLGDLTLPDIPLIALGNESLFESIGAPGVLSTTVFMGNVVTFDFAASEIRVTPGSLPDSDGVIPFATDQVVPNGTLRVGDVTVAADIDTGNGRPTFLPRALMEQLTLSAPPVPDTVRMVTGAYEVLRSEAAVPVKLEDVLLSSHEVLFQSRFDRANVGTPALLGLTLSVDQANRRYWLGRGQEPGSIRGAGSG
ncbi:MAG: retropepsin-like aspartic protease [Gemmatimonadota bacterium]